LRVLGLRRGIIEIEKLPRIPGVPGQGRNGGVPLRAHGRPFVIMFFLNRIPVVKAEQPVRQGPSVVNWPPHSSGIAVLEKSRHQPGLACHPCNHKRAVAGSPSS
jgi:hypothetical protein